MHPRAQGVELINQIAGKQQLKNSLFLIYKNYEYY